MAAVDEQKPAAGQDEEPWFLRSSYPVYFPSHAALTKPQSEFDRFLAEELRRRHENAFGGAQKALSDPEKLTDTETDTETFTVISVSTSAEMRKDLAAMDLQSPKTDAKNADDEIEAQKESNPNPFMQGLLSYEESEKPSLGSMENKMLTENADVAFRSTNDPLVDLFFELEDVVSGPRLRELLDAAWAADALSTLKIIINSRSIHLGKSSKNTFYRAAGWLAQNHPRTLVANLRWLCRPVIEKKAKKDEEGDIVIVESPNVDETDITRFDVTHGVSHGYWKDLLNILALAVNKKLDVLADPRDVLNVEDEAIKTTAQRRRAAKKVQSHQPPTRGGRKATIRGGRARGMRRFTPAATPHVLEEKTIRIGNPKRTKDEVRRKRHQAAVDTFNNNAVYRALHLTVTRLFAEQLQLDIALLRSSDSKAKRNISLCGKWAPSQDHFHDRHTCVISSIAEIMYPRESFDHVLTATDTRQIYLRHAREQYRKDISALRKHLEVVERDITASTFANIKYDRLPSIALQKYTKLFIEKDLEHFDEYLSKVAEGKAKISGATLFPSTLVQAVSGAFTPSASALQQMTPAQLIEHKVKSIEAKAINGQWNTLVQRIKDSGTLSSSIAVCDVSGSMSSPKFNDKTCPMDSAIGLSLLVAEVTEPPFGGVFITFSESPTVERIDLSSPFVNKVKGLKVSSWGYNTNLVAVFESLILPMAIKNEVKPEDMVKRVFVFSDMQFDQAQSDSGEGSWQSSYERIKSKYATHGYEMPELVFWNLAGGRAGFQSGLRGGRGGSRGSGRGRFRGGAITGDPTAPKPVDAAEEGMSLVSGYSQGMLKMFMENGSFEEPEEEAEEKAFNEKNEEGGGDEPQAKKAKKDPSATVRKAISHKAYEMLRVLD